MRILVVSTDFSYPASSGITVKTVNMLHSLSGDNSCDLVAVRGRQFDPEGFQRDLPNVVIRALLHPPDTLNRWWALSCLFRGMPPATAWRLSPKTIGIVGELLSTSWSDYDVIVCDMYPALRLIPPEARNRLLLTINDSHALGSKNSARTWTLSTLLRHVYYRFWEPRALRLARTIHVVSHVDAMFLRKLMPCASVETVPITVADEYFRVTVPDYTARRVLIHLSFSTSPDAPRVRRLISFLVRAGLGTDIEWVLLGEGSERTAGFFPPQYSVRTFDRVADHAACLASCPYALFFERCGSGTKNRAVQAMAVGAAVVCTVAIASGIAGASPSTCAVVPEDELAAWDALRSLLDDPIRARTMGHAAREVVHRHHSLAATRASWLRLVHEVAGGRCPVTPVPVFDQ